MEPKDFFKKNFNVYHIIGMVLGAVLAAIYWAKAGHLSDNINAVVGYFGGLYHF